MRSIKIALLTLFMVAVCIVPYSFATDIDDEQSIRNTETISITQPDSNHVYFGSYPQTEVVSSVDQCGTYGGSSFQISDCIIDPELYSALENATWSRGKETINGETYCRIKKSSSDKNTNTYIWADDITWHYFKYEPLKWRILKMTDKDAFLLCDKLIDRYCFYPDFHFTYGSSYIRTWLNDTFYNKAFNQLEKSAIKRTNVNNSEGEITKDKIFLLSVDEVSGEEGAEYGFASDPNEKDPLRIKWSSTYAKAQGLSTKSPWWLRTTRERATTMISDGYMSTACIVQQTGDLYAGGRSGMAGRANGPTYYSVCPALHIKLDSNNPIIAKCSHEDITLSQTTYSYDGTEKKPNVTIEGLWAGRDYELFYNNSIGPGIATVTARGIGNYSGSLSAEYKIGYDLPAKNKFALSSNNYTYDGHEKCPTVTVDGLAEGTDYEVHYSNNVAAGTATAIIEGTGNYLGTRTLSYTIDKLDISTVNMRLDSTHFNYTGEAIDPPIMVNGLELGKDYSVYYSNNTGVGSGTITIAGIGSCIGAAYLNFDIHGELHKTNAVAATCTTDGNSEYWACSCGKYFSDSEGKNEIEENSWVEPAKNHTYGDWAVTTNATCTEDGSKEKVCSICDDKVTEVIPANGHSFSDEFTVDTEPTCTAEGSKSRHCANCDEVVEITAIPANGHSFSDEFTVDTEPTCTAEGSKSRHCANCDEVVEITAIPANGHSFSDEFTVDTEPTCTAEGSKSRHCANCAETTDITAIPSSGHSFGNWEMLTPSTCEDSGLQKHVCGICGFTETDGLSPNGHDWDEEFTVDVPETCTTEGSRSIHCKNCSIVKDSEVILAKGHDWDSDPTIDKNPTCTTDGSQSVHCKACNEIKDQASVPATGHQWDASIYTWSKDNKTITATSVCLSDATHKETETVTVTAKVTKAATYTAMGQTTYAAMFKNTIFPTQTKTLTNIAQLPKKTNTIIVKTKKPAVKFAKLKKRAQTITTKKAFAVSKAQGRVIYKKVSGNKKITINSAGKITLKKGLKKGTYKIKVKVTAGGTTVYKAGAKTVTIRIKVK